MTVSSYYRDKDKSIVNFFHFGHTKIYPGSFSELLGAYRGSEEGVWGG
jgi:hypothetical protein